MEGPKDFWRSIVIGPANPPYNFKRLMSIEDEQKLKDKRRQYPDNQGCGMLVFDDKIAQCLVHEIKPKDCRSYLPNGECKWRQ